MTAGASIGAGHDNGFNSLRLVAAIAVLISHSFVLTTGTEEFEPLFRLTRGQSSFGFVAVAIFFILSGVLISTSAERSSSPLSFWTKRAMRILPGLWVSVLLTICIVGPLFTVVSLSDYFSSGTTLSYLKNMLFLPSDYRLAGVFDDRPYSSAVNGSLWTLKYEVACYVICAVAIALPRFRRILVFLLWLTCILVFRIFKEAGLEGAAYHIVTLAGLLRFYGAGMLIYLWRERIPFRTDLACLAAVAVLVSIFTPIFNEVLATFGAYLVLHFGYHASRWFRAIASRGDLSYGVYIYAFPVQQALVPLCLGLPLAWLANSILALFATLILAWLSWRWVERPTIELGKRLTQRRV